MDRPAAVDRGLDLTLKSHVHGPATFYLRLQKFGRVDQRPENVFEAGLAVANRGQMFLASRQFARLRFAGQAAQIQLEQHLLVVGPLGQQPAQQRVGPWALTARFNSPAFIIHSACGIEPPISSRRVLGS